MLELNLYVGFMKGRHTQDTYFKDIFEMRCVCVWSTLLGCTYLDLMTDRVLCSEN